MYCSLEGHAVSAIALPIALPINAPTASACPLRVWHCVSVSILLHAAVMWVSRDASHAPTPPEKPQALQVAFAPSQPQPQSQSQPQYQSKPWPLRSAPAQPLNKQQQSATHSVQPPSPHTASPAITASADAAPSLNAQPTSQPMPAAAPSPVSALPDTPPSHGAWLSKSLFQLMNTRKRYPLMARRLGLEGRVLIEAVINERGQLLSAEIKQSSGHELLDQDALALLKSITPIDVDSHRLGSINRVTIPLKYALE